MDTEKIEQATYHIRGLLDYMDEILLSLSLRKSFRHPNSDNKALKELILRNRDIRDDTDFIISNLCL